MTREPDIIIDFTDITMASVDGVFAGVAKIMLKEPPFNDKWMIRATASISSDMGIGVMVLHFYGDKRIIIDDYDPSVNDVYYNPDVRNLCQWAQDNGWGVPQPSTEVAKKYKEFWKYFWEVYLIDCDYFDKVYGKRDAMDYDS